VVYTGRDLCALVHRSPFPLRSGSLTDLILTTGAIVCAKGSAKIIYNADQPHWGFTLGADRNIGRFLSVEHTIAGNKLM
jgi:hypothetical protein